MPKVVREKEMAASREAIRAAITRFEEYPDFLTEVVSAKIVPGATPKVTQVKFELEIIKKFQYTLEFDYEKEDVIRWRLVEGTFFKKNEGSWVLKPSGDGTHATYELDLDLGFMVPGWIAKRLTEVNLPKLLESYEKRAVQLKKEGKVV